MKFKNFTQNSKNLLIIKKIKLKIFLIKYEIQKFYSKFKKFAHNSKN